MPRRPADALRKPGLTELIDRRDEFTKVYANGPGKFVLVQSNRPSHWFNSSTQLYDEIDLEWNILTDSSPAEARIRFSEWRCQVAINRLTYRFQDRTGATFVSELREIDGTPINRLPLNIQPEVRGEQLYFPDVLPDLDIYLMAKPGGVEWFKVLKGPAAPTEFVWRATEDPTAQYTISNKAWGVDSRPANPLPHRMDITVQIGQRTVLGNGLEQYNVRERFNGTTFTRRNPTRTRVNDPDLVYPLIWDVLETVTISATADDVYSNSGNGPLILDYSNILIVGDAGFHNGPTSIGLRFPGVGVPQGATIDDATISVFIDTYAGNQGAMTFVGDDLDNPAIFSSPNVMVDDIIPTTASLSINPSGAGNFDIACTGIVQELVDRTGFTSGNAMKFRWQGLTAGPTGYHFIADSSHATLAAPVLTINYTAGSGIDGTADFNLPVLTTTGIGDVAIDGIADFALPVPTITGIGTRGDGTGVADFNLPVPTITGIGTRGDGTGVADFNLPVPTITGIGNIPIAGSADFALPVLTLTGIGNIPIAGIADFALPVLTITGIGTRGDGTGVADFALPILTITGAGTVATSGSITGTADFNLPVPTITGIGNIAIAGLASFNLPVPTITGIGTRGDGTGIADFALPVLTITGVGVLPVVGLADFALPILTVTGLGTRGDGTGVADFNLPAIGIPAIGDILVSGIADFALPTLALSATGVVGALTPIIGTADFNLPSLWVNTQGGVDIPMVNIFSVTGQSGAITGTAFTLERKAGAWFVNRDVLSQIILGSGSATIHIEISLNGGSTFTDIQSSVAASAISVFNLPPIIRVRLSAATAATVNVWLDADLVVTRVNN